MVKISSAQVSVLTGGVFPEYPCERVVDGRPQGSLTEVASNCLSSAIRSRR
jgi:hypothetical protein